MKIFYFTQAYKQENETIQTEYNHWKVDQQISEIENYYTDSLQLHYQIVLK